MHLVFERWGFAFSLARGDSGGVSWVVEQAGGREGLSLCGGVPVPANGRRRRCRWQGWGGSWGTWRCGGSFGVLVSVC